MVDKRSVAPEEDALLDVTQRLARQIDQQLTQLRRMRDRPGVADSDQATGLGEFEHLARRMRRDTGRLRLLCGADPAGPGGPVAPRSVADLLADVAADSAQPVRVTVRPAPIATVEPRAAVELVHVLAEVVDGALAESGFGVTMGGRLGPAGLTVDVAMEGPRRPREATEQVAEAMARRSAAGVQVHRGTDGPYAIVLCPARALTVPAQRRVDPEPGVDGPRRAEPFGVRTTSAGGTSLFGAGNGYGNGNGNGPAPPPALGVDPLFGPLPAMEPVGTPIYEAVASAWFREDGFADPAGGSDAVPATAGDLEWQAAAARAARAEDEAGDTTASGLPRRRPGRQMVTPPLQHAAAGRDARPVRPPDERAPDRVRDRLDGYQRGLRQGRHRAVEAEPGV